MRTRLSPPALHILTFVAALSASTLHAQTSGTASLPMNANVVQPLTVSVLRSLDFGTIFVGGSKTIAPTAATAGQIDVKGQGGANLTVTLTMPTMLMLGSTGVGLTTNAWTYVTGSQQTPTSFTGGSATPVAMVLPTAAGTAHLTIGIGATASAGSGQTAGDYTGSGQVVIAYTDY